MSTEDRPKIPPVQSFKPPVGAKVREDPRRPHDASKPGGRNEADRWVKFAAAAFQQAGIRRGDADQLAFEDGLGNFDETPARVWTVPTRKGITRNRNLVHEEVTASQNKERNLIHCREYNRKGWSQQQLCRVVRGMDYTYHASQAKAQPTQDNRELVWAARQSENSKVRKKELEQTLRKTPFFMNMEMEKVGIIHKIAKVATVRHEREGQVIFRQGDQATSVYLLLKGSVSVLVRPGEAPSSPRADLGKDQMPSTLTEVRRVATEVQQVKRSQDTQPSGIGQRRNSQRAWELPQAPDERDPTDKTSVAEGDRTLWSRVNSRPCSAMSWKIREKIPTRQAKKRDDTVRKQDEQGRNVYSTVEGFSTFTEESNLGDQVNTLEAGSVFGEVALLSEAPRSASIRCSADCELLLFNARVFRKVLSEFVDVAKVVGLLQSVDFFHKMEETSPGVIHKLAKTAEFTTELKGQVIFRQNDPGKDAFILVKGQVAVHAWDTTFGKRKPVTPRIRKGEMPTLTDFRRSGKERWDLVARKEEAKQGKPPRIAQSFRTTEGYSTFSKESHLGPLLTSLHDGSLFGELALQNTEPRRASVVCLEDCELLRLRKEDFLAAIRDRKDQIYFFHQHVPSFKEYADKRAQGALTDHPSLAFASETFKNGQTVTSEGVFAIAKIYVLGPGANVDFCRYREPRANPAYVLSRRPRSAPKSKANRTELLSREHLQQTEHDLAFQASAARLAPDEDVEVLDTLEEGRLFGTMAALPAYSPEPFSIVVRCTTETCTLYSIDGSSMQNLPSKLLTALREQMAEEATHRIARIHLPEEEESQTATPTSMPTSRSRSSGRTPFKHLLRNSSLP